MDDLLDRCPWEGWQLAQAISDFQVFAKPMGAICNLDCHYCYYLKKEYLYPENESFRISDDLLEQYIVQHFAATTGTTVNFSWHGGEPTVLGVDFYRKVVALQREHLPPGMRIINGIQTNGILIDDEWCRFLASENFGVGLSLDGPQEMHDRYRLTKGQKPSHRQAMRAFRLLRHYKVPTDLLCVLNDYNVQYPTQVYRFFKSIGAEYLAFLPIVEPKPEAPGGVSPYTVPAAAYGEFLCTVFDEWVREDTERIIVQIFEEAMRPARGLEHSLCIFRETCGEFPVLEHNGDFFSCDHFVDPQHRVGNIGETPLGALLASPAQHAFGLAKRDDLPRFCQLCEVRPMCNGGCPKDRFTRTPDGEAGLNYLCAGFKRFFAHCLPYTLQTSSPWQSASTAQKMKGSVKAAESAAGRNDPCPCGSGRKYKKCCLA
jgi:uncharacterized protein